MFLWLSNERTTMANYLLYEVYREYVHLIWDVVIEAIPMEEYTGSAWTLLDPVIPRRDAKRKKNKNQREKMMKTRGGDRSVKNMSTL